MIGTGENEWLEVRGPGRRRRAVRRTRNCFVGGRGELPPGRAAYEAGRGDGRFGHAEIRNTKPRAQSVPRSFSPLSGAPRPRFSRRALYCRPLVFFQRMSSALRTSVECGANPCRSGRTVLRRSNLLPLPARSGLPRTPRSRCSASLRLTCSSLRRLGFAPASAARPRGPVLLCQLASSSGAGGAGSGPSRAAWLASSGPCLRAGRPAMAISLNGLFQPDGAPQHDTGAGHRCGNRAWISSRFLRKAPTVQVPLFSNPRLPVAAFIEGAATARSK